MSDNLHNLIDYSTAKRILKDLKEAYKHLQDVSQKLEPYIKYKAVFESVRGIIEWYPLLQSQIKTYEKIVAKKGQKLTTVKK